MPSEEICNGQKAIADRLNVFRTQKSGSLIRIACKRLRGLGDNEQYAPASSLVGSSSWGDWMGVQTENFHTFVLLPHCRIKSIRARKCARRMIDALSEIFVWGSCR